VRYVQGSVERIHQQDRCVDAIAADGKRFSLAYDRLLLSSGSKMARPDEPGIHAHAFSIDQQDEAVELDLHLRRLASQPSSASRNTVVVVGGGFTGIELACELPQRLRKVLGADAQAKVVLIEGGADIGPELGAGPRPVIEQALDDMGVVRLLGTAVTAVTAEGVELAGGKRIAAQTVIWTGGPRASTLTQQISAERDALGRLHVARDLRVKGVPSIFAAGDVALAATDNDGNHAMMSCQHAIDMGRYAGYNVAADLLGLPTLEYQQPFYVTCLDLGGAGAVYTEGWEREVKMSGAEAKALKVKINTQWIYPPVAERAVLFAAADPLSSVVS
jgi:NADH dehydrogenase